MLGRHGKTILLAVVSIICVFVASYLYFANKMAQERPSQQKAVTVPAERQLPLPEAHLVDLAGADLPDEALRKGKVILVFVSPGCDACQTESEFLKKVAGKRNDVSFFGVVSFGEPKTALAQIGEMGLPFKVYFDDGHRLSGKLGVKRVPIKIFVEDGVIKKMWGGATNSTDEEASFIEWLEKA